MQAASSTTTVTTVRIDSAGRYSPTRSSRSGTTRTPLPPASGPIAPPLSCRRPRASASACSAETPGRSRPTALNATRLVTAAAPGPGAPSVVDGSMTYGNQNSVSDAGKWNPSASTPTTRCWPPFRSTVVPTTSGSDAKRLVQARWLSNATRGAPIRASSSRKSRPRCGDTRNSGNSAGDALAPRRAAPSRSPRSSCQAASCSNDSAFSCSRGIERFERNRSDRFPVKRDDAPMRTIAPGSGKGSGRSRMPLTMLNMAVAAPMPSARTSVTATAKPGLRRRPRTVWRRSRPRSSSQPVHRLPPAPASRSIMCLRAFDDAHGSGRRGPPAGSVPRLGLDRAGAYGALAS